MSHELMITSAPRGLQPGSMGFCTVAMTPQLPSVLQQRLETLSSYRHVFPPMDARAKSNPVCFQHLRLQVGGKNYSVLSRIGDTGLDYTERSNKFGHHLALLPAERFPAGPAAAMLHPKTFQTAWKGEPRELELHRSLAAASVPPGVARQWKAATGDSGWAGILGEMYLENQKDPVYVEYPAGTDVLPLFAEALALLPEEERWGVTFSTYFQGLPPELTCHWRGVVKDSPEAKQARSRNAKVISIHPGSTAPQGGALAAWARTGAKPAVSEIMPSSEDNDLSPLTFKPERKGSRSESGQPYELKRDYQAKGSLRSELPPSKGSSFSVMSLLMGLLLGFLVSALVGLGVWFALKGDPGLEVAREHEVGAAKEKINKLEEQLSKSQTKMGVDKQKIDDQGKSLNEQLEQIKVLKAKVNDLQRRVDSESKQTMEPAQAKKNDKKTSDQRDVKPAEIVAIRKEAIYYDFTRTKGIIDNSNSEDYYLVKINDDQFMNAKVKSVKLIRRLNDYRDNIILWIRNYDLFLLKDIVLDNGLKICKDNASGIGSQPILEFRINKLKKLEAVFHVEQTNDVLKLMRNSIVEVELMDNKKYYLTGIQPYFENSSYVMQIDKKDLDSCDNPKALPPYRKEELITILSGPQNESSRKQMFRNLSELVYLNGNMMSVNFKSSIVSNMHYDNTVKISASPNTSSNQYDPVAVFVSKYRHERITRETSDDMASKLRISVESSKIEKVTFGEIKMFFDVSGVDVLIWSKSHNSNDGAGDANRNRTHDEQRKKETSFGESK